MKLRRPGDPFLVQKAERPISKQEIIDRRAFWLTGYTAIKNLLKTVAVVSAEIQKSEGGQLDHLTKDMHERLSPIFRTTRRLMREALPDAVVDEDEDLKRLRTEIDPSENGGVQPPTTGSAAPLDDNTVNADPRLADRMRKGPRIDMSRLAPHSKRGVLIDNRRVR